MRCRITSEAEDFHVIIVTSSIQQNILLKRHSITISGHSIRNSIVHVNSSALKLYTSEQRPTEPRIFDSFTGKSMVLIYRAVSSPNKYQVLGVKPKRY